MTSQLNVDTIVDKAGSGGSNVKMANTSTYVSEGGAKTANNVVQGLAKSWVYAQQRTATVGVKDSFNVASWVDSTTGQSLTNFTNVMSNTTYHIIVGHNYNNDAKTGCKDGVPLSTSQLKHKDYDYTGTSYDHDFVYNIVHGDLA